MGHELPRPDNVVGVSEVAGTPIDHAYIGSCASGMFEDMRESARVLRGHRIDPRIRLLATPATNEVARQAAAEGLFDVISAAGGIFTVPGSGLCAGGRIGGVTYGEV